MNFTTWKGSKDILKEMSKKKKLFLLKSVNFTLNYSNFGLCWQQKTKEYKRFFLNSLRIRIRIEYKNTPCELETEKLFKI